MEQKQIIAQMLDFNRTTFDNAFNAMSLLQDQAEKATNIMLEQSPWIPEESRKAIHEWVKVYKKGREDLRKTVDENYKKVESFFTV